MCAPQSTSEQVVSSDKEKGETAPQWTQQQHQQQQHQQQQQQHMENPSTNKDKSHETSKQKLVYATRMGAASMNLLFMATTLTLPYLQSKRDALGCDATCQAQMSSARSAFTLVGATLVGQWSDVTSHRARWLLVGVVAAAGAIYGAHAAQTVPQLWASLVPQLLQQNMHVMKALVSEYHDDHEQQSTHIINADTTTNATSTTNNNQNNPKSLHALERASSAGTLGMAGGLALMVGPWMGSSLLSSYQHATWLSFLLLVLSAVLIAMLPSLSRGGKGSTKAAPQPKQEESLQPNTRKTWTAFGNWPQSPAACYILLDRLLFGLSFHMFSALWPASLRARFQFGPQEYGLFFSVVGLFFALSQGIVSQLLKFLPSAQGRARLLVTCTLLVAVARYQAYYTTSLVAMYAWYALLISAVGITSTIVGADTSQIADQRNVGSFFGLVAAVESGAGMLGPLLASGLTSVTKSTTAPLWAVGLIGVLSTVMTAMGYERFVFQHIQKQQQQQQQQQQQRQQPFSQTEKKEQ